MVKKIVLIIGMMTLLFSVVYADKLADFTLADKDGNQVNIYDILNDGNIVIIDFWATWCVPCIKALPHLNAMHEDNENVVVVIISEDSARQSKRAVKMMDKWGYTVVSLFDPKGEVKNLLGVKVMPETFYVTPDGEIVSHHVGYREGEEIAMKEELNKIIESVKAPEQTKAATEESPEESSEVIK